MAGSGQQQLENVSRIDVAQIVASPRMQETDVTELDERRKMHVRGASL